SIAVQCPNAAVGDQMSSTTLVRERRKDRGGVVSSVYPGGAYAVGGAKSDRESTRVQSPKAAKCCQESAVGPHYARETQVAAVRSMTRHVCVLIDIWTTAR